MSVVAVEPVDRDAYIGNAVGICFFLFLVNSVTLLANPAWKRWCKCNARGLRCWRHHKTCPPPWELRSGCKDAAAEEGTYSEGQARRRTAAELAAHDDTFWGWLGLDAKHLVSILQAQAGNLSTLGPLF